MSWEEFKNDIGCGWTVLKWIVGIIFFFFAGSWFYHSCVQNWKDIF